MKGIIKIMLLTFPLLGFGQMNIKVKHNYVLLGKDTINRKVDNLKEGNWIYYKSGTSSYTRFHDGSCVYQKTMGNITSKGNYRNSKRVGKWEYYYYNGALKRTENYTIDGIKHLLSFEYLMNGKIKSESKWNNGKLEEQTVYFQNGKVKSQSFWDNTILEKQKAFYPNSQLKFNSNSFKGGQKKFEIFHESGIVKYKGTVTKDWEIKKLEAFDDEGNKIIIRKITFGELLVNEGLTNLL